MSIGDEMGPEQGGVRSRFVLLCAPDREGEVHPPEALRRALLARDAEVTIRTSAYDAMADLVEHEQSLRARQRREPMVLLLVEPESLAHAQALAAAAARYTPHAVCWRFGAADDPQLRAFEIEPEGPTRDAGAAGPGVTVSPDVAEALGPRRRHVAAGPRLRLTEDAPPVEADEAELERGAPEVGEGGDEPERPLLTEEELEILLSDDWERQTREGGSA